MSAGVAIRAEGLTRRFESLVAVDGLSFTVGEGELFGLVGPDGAGKTTTLRMLAGVLRPSAGDAIIGGTSITADPEAVKSDLAYMSQRFGLYTDLTVLENLTFYADLYQVPRAERAARLERLFQFSNLGPFQHRLAGKLSGGMKQKLGLSCALIHRPRLLLLDEPTFGVDPVSRRDLWLIVHGMVAEGITAVVSTAYLDEAERFDRLALIDRGRLLALDSPAALQQTLEGQIVSVAAHPIRLARDAAQRLSGVRRAVVFGETLHLTLAPGYTDHRAIESALAEAGCQGVELRPAAPSLEDVFIDRVERPGATVGVAG